ncbi:type I restriction modification system, restriction subunit [Hylemonella gracilis str. Niagara R]|uniref:Type I restriction modification system, restriction subunit n=1 Tax=Hylemonella gracilis str. Niagara R TaxID=1458275 RepID=A0A016XG80_9BURK|nr:hypothetical protein [Hylemonella gracilis]EYC50925.1 type I restriction modification system, restriction subunit [Hylemonella gracilis str. Niagara R]
MTPEQKARLRIDELLAQAGWLVCNLADADIHADPGQVKGVAIREFPLNAGYGYADYLLYVNGKACGVIEAKKKEAVTLTGVELQSVLFVSMSGFSSVAISRASKLRTSYCDRE